MPFQQAITQENWPKNEPKVWKNEITAGIMATSTTWSLHIATTHFWFHDGFGECRSVDISPVSAVIFRWFDGVIVNSIAWRITYLQIVLYKVYKTSGVWKIDLCSIECILLLLANILIASLFHNQPLPDCFLAYLEFWMLHCFPKSLLTVVWIFKCTQSCPIDVAIDIVSFKDQPNSLRSHQVSEMPSLR